ncbi:MAG: hypothetical protein ACOX7H_05090 [Bacillota bacterium]|jgi:hypothetical protein
MATCNKTGLNICEIDSQYKDQSNTGSCDVGRYSSSKVNNCFFNFDSINDEIPAGSVINSATLRLAQVSGGYSLEENILITLRSGNWGAFTWNSQPGLAATGLTVQLSGTSAGDRSFNVTSLIQWIVDNNSPAHIFKLERVPNTTSGSSDAKRFSTTASNHDLLITYTPPTAPSAPTNLSQTPNAFESALSLSWTKGGDGTNNPITGHDVRYQSSDDGSSWSSETAVTVGASSTYYDIPSATISSWSRGKYVRFRVGSISAYASTVYSGYSSAVRKNRAPNTPTGTPATNKSVYAPGETIAVSFTPPSPRDPDSGLSGDIAGYEVKMQHPDGTDYNGDQIVGTNASGSATSVSVSTTGWTPGLQWKFLVRGYDSYGVRGAWSAATALIMIGTPLKVLVSGSLKSVAEQYVLVNGVLKQVSEIKVLVDGVLKNLTV